MATRTTLVMFLTSTNDNEGDFYKILNLQVIEPSGERRQDSSTTNRVRNPYQEINGLDRPREILSRNEKPYKTTVDQSTRYQEERLWIKDEYITGDEGLKSCKFPPLFGGGRGVHLVQLRSSYTAATLTPPLYSSANEHLRAIKTRERKRRIKKWAAVSNTFSRPFIVTIPARVRPRRGQLEWNFGGS